jgi:hypothetical protein
MSEVNPVHLTGRRREASGIDRREASGGGSPLRVLGTVESLDYVNPTGDEVSSVQMSGITLGLESPATVAMTATITVAHDGGDQSSFFTGAYWLSAYFVVDGAVYRESPVAIRRWDGLLPNWQYDPSLAGDVTVAMSGVHSLVPGSHNFSVFIESNLRQTDIRAHLQLMVGSTQNVSSLVEAEERTPLPESPAPPSWSPRDFGHLALRLWYDADDDDTFSFSSGTTVSEWRDKSGWDGHLTAGFAERNGTVNGRSTVLFTPASSHYLSGNVGGVLKPFTIFLVAKQANSDGVQRTAAGFISGFRDGRIYKTSGGNIAGFQGSVVAFSSNWGTDLQAPVATFADGSSRYWVNAGGAGTSTNFGGQVASSWFRVGAYGTNTTDGAPAPSGEHWDGHICEIVVLRRQPTADELDSWYDYVEAKWGPL